MIMCSQNAVLAANLFQSGVGPDYQCRRERSAAAKCLPDRPRFEPSLLPRQAKTSRECLWHPFPSGGYWLEIKEWPARSESPSPTAVVLNGARPVAGDYSANRWRGLQIHIFLEISSKTCTIPSQSAGSGSRHWHSREPSGDDASLDGLPPQAIKVQKVQAVLLFRVLQR